MFVCFIPPFNIYPLYFLLSSSFLKYFFQVKTKVSSFRNKYKEITMHMLCKHSKNDEHNQLIPNASQNIFWATRWAAILKKNQNHADCSWWISGDSQWSLFPFIICLNHHINSLFILLEKDENFTSLHLKKASALQFKKKNKWTIFINCNSPERGWCY